ncbi:hypothetical protein ATCC90586_012165 [Pythium insidiosum]|nr:hypothetical protein ATCC90586_012165 [Pythium insidiosum]
MYLSGASKVADAVLHVSAVKIGQIKAETETETESSEAKTEAEVRATFGAGLYGGGCGLGFPMGRFFYC